MSLVFYISAFVAVVATFMTITRANAVHALLYLVVSFLAAAMALFALGAAFAAALEVIVYAGAIVVLFVFVVMMLDQGPPALRRERAWLKPSAWIGPGILALVLLGELLYAVVGLRATPGAAGGAIDPKAVGMALFGPYAVAVEIASLLLLAGLVAAFHLGKDETK